MTKKYKNNYILCRTLSILMTLIPLVIYTIKGFCEGTPASKVIYNHAYHDGTEPSTDTLEELPAINEQNTNNYLKNKLEGYANLTALLDTDVTQDFISKFKNLFLVIVEPELPLWYITEYGEDK